MKSVRWIALVLATVLAIPVLLMAQTRNSVLWFHLRNNSVVASKVAVTSVTVTVLAGQPSVATAAAPALVGATILGIRPAGNQDQFVDNVVLDGTGVVTVTLAANATANNVFVVTLLRTRP